MLECDGCGKDDSMQAERPRLGTAVPYSKELLTQPHHYCNHEDRPISPGYEDPPYRTLSSSAMMLAV